MFIMNGGNFCTEKLRLQHVFPGLEDLNVYSTLIREKP